MSTSEAPSVASSEIRVFASLPLVLFAFCRTLGMRDDELLEISGLTPEDITDPDALVDYESLIRIWRHLVVRFPREPLGLRYADMITPEILGVVGRAVENTSNFRQAFELYVRYCHLADPYLRMSVELGSGVYRLVIDHEPRVVALAEPIEMMVASMVRSSRMLNPQAPAPLEVCFRHSARHAAEIYTAHLNAPVRFCAPWSGIVVDSASFELAVIGADLQIGKYLQQNLETMLERTGPPPSAPLDTRVRTAISAGLTAGELDQARVAQRLGMSIRSLQRGLRALGTSFSDQLDEVRRARALALLQRDELSVAEVASMLGYGDARAFYRSFRRWTGLTPSAYRRAHSR